MNKYLGEFENLQSALHGVLCALLGAPEVTVRGYTTREIHPCLLVIKNPMRRTLLYPKRGNNPFAALAETLWVLGGWNSIGWLERFLPRAKDFSDDGKTWRAGYGPRLRRYIGEDDNGMRVKIDQIKYVYDTLLKDNNSRQAIVNIWDAAKECTIGSSRDFPCNNWLQFLIRDNKLEINITVRSNDAMWGFAAINIYEWSVLQELLAGLLKVNVGNLNYFVGSMHIYQQHYEKVNELIKSYIPIYEEIDIFRFFRSNDNALTYDDIFCDIKRFLQHMTDTKCFLNDNSSYSLSCLGDCAYLLKTYLHYITGNLDKAYESLSFAQMTDLKLACRWWLDKKQNALTTIEESLTAIHGA